jgi:uncharacterized protein
MTTFLIAFVISSLAVFGMAIGWLMQGKELKGSCGGLSTFTGERCEACGGQPENCQSRNTD